MNRVQAWDSRKRMNIYLALSFLWWFLCFLIQFVCLLCVCMCSGSCVWLLPCRLTPPSTREQKPGRRVFLILIVFPYSFSSSPSCFSSSSSSSVSSSSSRRQASVNTSAGHHPPQPPRLHTLSHRLFRFVEPSRRKIPPRRQFDRQRV